MFLNFVDNSSKYPFFPPNLILVLSLAAFELSSTRIVSLNATLSQLPISAFVIISQPQCQRRFNLAIFTVQ